MTKKIQMMSHDKEWQVVDGVETLVPVEQFDIDPITDSSCVKIEGFRTLEETLNEKNMFTPEVNATKVMDKVGGEYHQNVVDGAYEEAILYGNTQVNLCEEDTNVALQIPTTFTSFNNGELQINNKENQVVAPLIKGVTMVNLAQTNSASITSGNATVIRNVKGNTVYTLSFTFTTKNTNSGVTIQCYDGNGTFIENTIHKTGLGDVVKFTFATHANTAKVHICNNAAYGGETIQLDDIMLIEGDQTALDIPFFKGMKSVELVRPLTNLFANDTPTAHSFTNVTNNNGQVTATSQSSAAWTYACFNITFKSNTSYIVMWDSLSYTQTGNTNQTIAICYGNDIIANIDNNFTNKRSIIFNTGDRNPSDINLRIHATTKNTETGTTTVTGLRVFEYDDYLRSVDLQSIGWFSGTKNVAVEPIKTCSKNLYPYGDINFTPTSTGWYDAKGNSQMTGDIASKSHSRFLLEKGTYYFSIESNTNAFCQLTDDKENMGVNANSSFTLQEDKYVTLRVKVTTANTSTTVTNIQIERGETATDYVAHDSRYYEPNGQNAIVLRSLPSGVCDTFNLQTGEYTRRIGEIVLDGSENWTLNKPLGDGSFNQFVVNRVQAKKIIRQEVVCDKLISCYHETVNNVIWIYDGAVIVIQSSHTNANELKTWLQQNPLTVQYEFRESSTTIIPRTIKRNNNGTVSTVDFGTYTNKENLRLPKNPSYLTINSMTSIKPVVEPITYIDFKTRLKANTDYSVIIDKDNTDKTINLGGTSKTYTDKMLVRTPSINLEQNLRISGSGSIQNIMVIEGDVLDKELPYFNGMCNVKMPIVRNCGKNFITGKVIEKVPDVVVFEICRLKPNQQYIISSNYNFAQGRVSLMGKNNEFIIQDWAENKKIFKAPSDVYNYNQIRFWKAGLSYDKLTMYFQLEELESGTQATPYEPYRGNDICIAQGEIGLSQDMFEQGGFSGSSGNTYDNCKANTNTNIRMRTKGLITVKPNTTYIVNNNTSPNMNHVFYLFDESQKYLGGNITVNAKSFVTPNNCRYVSLMFSKDNNANISVSEFKQELFQLLELDSTVQLRSLPNGVKDELNLLTGEYIQRVGEVVLDGSSDENIGIFTTKDEPVKTSAFYFLSDSLGTNNNAYSQTYISNSLNFNDVYTTDLECFNIHENRIRFRFLKEKATTIDECRTYLASNPITVQYELAEPIISYPRIVSNTQEREVGVKLPNGVCDTYNPSTGITIKRVGKVVLDGSENWYFDTTKTNTQVFGLVISDMAMTRNNLYCETMMVVSGKDVEAIGSLDGALYIALLKTKASTVDELKTYLASNPVTVWYELKNPIITTDIILPNGVHDEYNPLTGLYTKRVGYIELDGSENWRLGTTKTNTQVFELIMLNEKLDVRLINNIICDKLPTSDGSFSDTEKIAYTDSYVNNATTMSIYIALLKTKASTLNELKTYLSQNPIKVWYELSTPITYQLTPYFGLPMPYAYKDGYLIMDSAYEGQTLPPEIKYKLLANRTGQITQNNIKLQNHTSKLSNLEAMLVEATLQSMYEREMMAFNLEMVNINLINLEE